MRLRRASRVRGQSAKHLLVLEFFPVGPLSDTSSDVAWRVIKGDWDYCRRLGQVNAAGRLWSAD